MSFVWIKATRHKGKPLYIKTPHIPVLQAGQYALIRLKQEGYDPDNVKKIGTIKRPPRNKRGAIIIGLPPESLVICPHCEHLVLDTSTCILCGAILEAKLRTMTKNVK